MLSFKQLSERKTKVTLNPKLKDVMEKKGKKDCPKCDGKGCKHCGGTGYHSEGEGEMTEAKKKDDTYLETDFKKRQKNNEKARKDLMKGPQMKNPHFESTEENAYVSQEEVSEESTEEVAETENSILTFGTFNERTRYAKETGKDPQTGKESKKGGTMDGKGAFAAVRRDMIKTGGVMSSRKKAIQPQGKKKVKGAKPKFKTEPTPVDKIKNKLAQKRAPKPNPYKPRAGESD